MNLVCVLFPATRDAVLRGRVQEEGEPPPAWSAEEKLEKYCKFTFWGYKLCQHGYANKSWLKIRGGLSPPPPPTAKLGGRGWSPSCLPYFSAAEEVPHCDKIKHIRSWCLFSEQASPTVGRLEILYTSRSHNICPSYWNLSTNYNLSGFLWLNFGMSCHWQLQVWHIKRVACYARVVWPGTSHQLQYVVWRHPI